MHEGAETGLLGGRGNLEGQRQGRRHDEWELLGLQLPELVAEDLLRIKARVYRNLFMSGMYKSIQMLIVLYTYHLSVQVYRFIESMVLILSCSKFCAVKKLETGQAACALVPVLPASSTTT